jgi:hypothetical protein
MTETNICLNDMIDLLKFSHKIEMAISLGEHGYCSIMSNCPMAIKLRKMIEDMGMNVDTLVKDFKPVGSRPLLYTGTLPSVESIPAKLHLTFGDENVELDMTKFISSEAQVALENHISSIRNQNRNLLSYGQKLHSTYMAEIAKLRRTKTLPALEFSLAELAEYKMLASANTVNGVYVFYTPMTYEPQYLYDNGVRYEISDADKQLVRREGLYLSTSILAETRQIYNNTILNSIGGKFEHYHGRGTDCWGSVKTAQKWEGTLRWIRTYTNLLVKSILTINGESLMTRQPAGMPAFADLMSRATKLGREGDIRRTTPLTSTPDIATTWVEPITTFTANPFRTEEPAPGEPVRWGRRRDNV